MQRMLNSILAVLVAGLVVSCSPKDSDTGAESAKGSPDQKPLEAPFAVPDRFEVTFWGDAKGIVLSEVPKPDVPGETCYQVHYLPGVKHWGGLYWQSKAELGLRHAVSIKGASQIHFWTRGAKGGETVVFMGVGSPAIRLLSNEPQTRLTDEWQEIEISLEKEDLSSVEAVFGVKWVSLDDADLTFFLDDIRFE